MNGTNTKINMASVSPFHVSASPVCRACRIRSRITSIILAGADSNPFFAVDEERCQRACGVRIYMRSRK
ncbi:hypothetical protein BJV74DRAFT_839237 [Russula compacta]|nr:hypothetical protein BJV74DRAFT_839237 [Russula compacta]